MTAASSQTGLQALPWTPKRASGPDGIPSRPAWRRAYEDARQKGQAKTAGQGAAHHPICRPEWKAISKRTTGGGVPWLS